MSRRSTGLKIEHPHRVDAGFRFRRHAWFVSCPMVWNSHSSTSVLRPLSGTISVSSGRQRVCIRLMLAISPTDIISRHWDPFIQYV